jgi:hypothetical protein
MKRNPPSNRASFRGVILPALLALAVFAILVCGGPGLASTLRADDSAALETDHAFLDIENWGGTNWQAAGWPAIQIKKVRLERSIVQLGFDSVSPCVIGDSPNFLLRAQLDGRFLFLTNSREVAAGKPGAVLMQKKGRIFEGMLPRGGVLTDAAVDYGKETIHCTRGNLNPGNVNNPRFTSIRFIPARSGAGVGDNGGADSDNGDGSDNGNAGAGIGVGTGAGVAAAAGNNRGWRRIAPEPTDWTTINHVPERGEPALYDSPFAPFRDMRAVCSYRGLRRVAPHPRLFALNRFAALPHVYSHRSPASFAATPAAFVPTRSPVHGFLALKTSKNLNGRHSSLRLKTIGNPASQPVPAGIAKTDEEVNARMATRKTNPAPRKPAGQPPKAL